MYCQWIDRCFLGVFMCVCVCRSACLCKRVRMFKKKKKTKKKVKIQKKGASDMGVSDELIDVYKEMIDNQNFSLRVNVLPLGVNGNVNQNKYFLYQNKLTVKSVKFYLDGALGVKKKINKTTLFHFETFFLCVCFCIFVHKKKYLKSKNKKTKTD